MPRDPLVDKDIILEVGCLINLDQEEDIRSYLLQNYQTFSTEKVIQFLENQTYQSGNIYYCDIREVLLSIKHQINSVKTLNSLFRILHHLIKNDPSKYEVSRKIFMDFLQNELEKYLQVPLISSLADLLA